MTNTYIKPETKTIKVVFQHILAGSEIPTVGEIENPLARENNFDFFSFEEEEEAPGKSDDEDWEDFEDEDYP